VPEQPRMDANARELASISVHSPFSTCIHFELIRISDLFSAFGFRASDFHRPRFSGRLRSESPAREFQEGYHPLLEFTWC
jgi:hypothetical protein